MKHQSLVHQDKLCPNGFIKVGKKMKSKPTFFKNKKKISRLPNQGQWLGENIQ